MIVLIGTNKDIKGSKIEGKINILEGLFMKNVLAVLGITVILALGGGVYLLFFATQPAILSWRVNSNLRAEDAVKKLASGKGNTTAGLVSAAEHEDPSIRLIAVKALGKKSSGVMDVLIDSLEDEETKIRIAAADGLANFGTKEPEAARALVKAMRDRDETVRLRAISAYKQAHEVDLDGSSYGRVVEGLKAALGDRVKENRVAALRSLDTLDELDLSASDAVSEGLAKYNSTEDRIWAAQTLARIGDEKGTAVKGLAECVTDKSAELRIAAAQALMLYSPEAGSSASAALTKALENYSDPESRVAIMGALTAVGLENKDAMQQAGKILHETQNKNVRLAAIDYFGSMGLGAADHIDVLIGCLKSTDEEVGQAASLALTGIGEPAIIPLIRSMSDVETPGMSKLSYILAALENIDCKCRKAAVMQFGPEEKRYVAEAIQCVEKRGGGSVTKLDLLAGIGPEQDYVIPELLEYLEEYAASEDIQIRAASILGEFGDASGAAIPILTECLRDKSSKLVLQAIKSIEMIGLENAPAGQAPLVMKELRKLAMKDDEEFVRIAARDAVERILKKAKQNKTNLEVTAQQ